MSRVATDSKEMRQTRVRHLAVAARAPFWDGLPAIATDFSTDPFAPQYGGLSPYRHLASRLRTEFVVQADISGDDDVIKLAIAPTTWQGVVGIAKILRAAPAAYKAFTASEKRPPDKEELTASLLASADVHQPITGTDRDRAQVLETVFGIRPDKDIPPTYSMPFIFERTDTGVHYCPDADAINYANGIIGRLIAKGEIDRDVEKHRRCAAIGIVLDRLWERGVTICAEAPSLFPNDLSTKPVAYPEAFPY